MKLFCFPHAGGYSRYYNFLKDAEFEAVDQVILYEYYGRSRSSGAVRPENFDHLTELVTEFVDLHTEREEEFALFGHSMGAFVSYEAAVRLREKKGKTPLQVFLSGQRPPCTLEEGYYSSDPAVAVPYFRKLGGMEELWKASQRVQNYFLPVVLDDIRLLETYTPAVPDPKRRLPSCILLHGMDDAELEGHSMDLWKEHFSRIDGEYIFPGGHFYLEHFHRELIHIIDTAVKERKHDV